VLRGRYPKHSEASYRAKVNLIRYADDFFITGATKEVLIEEVMPLVKDFLTPRGLELSPEKTSITHIEDGFDFLGQNVRRYNGKLIIKPSRKNTKAFLSKVRGFIKANKQLNVGELIAHLNPVIRGWANYHQHVVSKRVFSKVDHEIFRCLWRWARRRHPGKGMRWVKNRYFRTQGSRNWIFSGELRKRDGTKKTVDLFRADSTPIRRHVKIKGEANPYDPQWETYFEKRLDVKMEVSLRGRRKLLYLWQHQNGLCPNCNQKITKITGWHSHHLIWRSRGGSDGAGNRVMLHPTCHKQIHSRSL
jgi:RNA-directed DNA polymerase